MVIINVSIILTNFPQMYREARQAALCKVFPELSSGAYMGASKRINYPRPLSEPPSPFTSRSATPAVSEHGDSDHENETESIDDEGEVSCSY